ncbi:MAG: phospho-N-acetylmuramoyl-pentapeptide-transferase [Planctomycetaceae bacterium]
MDIRLWELLVSAAAAFLTTLLLGRPVIRWLRRSFRERIASDSKRLDELHASKRGTPTMGGVLMTVGVIVGMLVCPSASVTWSMRWQVVLCVLSFSVLGACDDYVKAVTGRKGLTVRQKLTWQLLLGGLFGCWLEWTAAAERGGLFRGVWEWIPGVIWTTLWIAGGSNAVNLTDGLDGLAAGIVIVCGTGMAFVIGSQVTGSEWCVVPAILAGVSAGFLWYNRHPARVFMGDTGALSLGAVLGLAGVGAGVEWATVGCGLVFVLEVLSVVLQVGWYRWTRRRILLCSPLHNHFVFAGVPEKRIVSGFWMLAALGVVVTGVLVVWQRA